MLTFTNMTAVTKFKTFRVCYKTKFINIGFCLRVILYFKCAIMTNSSHLY